MGLNIKKTIGLFSLLALLIPSPCLSFLEEDEEIIKSSMPGIIRRIVVMPGQAVKSGDLLYIFEVMKMECSITSPRAGFIGSLYLTVGQHIEKDMSLITILPFMPVEKGGDPMSVDESPLPILQSIEPSIKDSSQNDLGEVASSPTGVIASEAKQSISEHQPSQQVSMPSWIAADSMSPHNDEAEGSEIGSFSAVVMPLPVEQAISEAENEPQTSHQEVMLPLVLAPIMEAPNNEGGVPDVFSPTGVSFSSQKVKIEEFQQGVNSSKASTHLLWLTGLLLLGFLFFRRPKSNMPYRVKNILTYKAAVNLNTGYLRDAA